MSWQIVRTKVPDERRERYLAAWTEYSGTLFAMGIETDLLEDEGARGRFIEVTRFGEGDEAALGDDRLAAIGADLEAACEDREGDLELFGEVSP